MPNEYPIMNIRAKYADQTPEGKDIDKTLEDKVDTESLKDGTFEGSIKSLKLDSLNSDEPEISAQKPVVEVMTGYAYANLGSSKIEKSVSYAGVVKNGNKLTIVYALKVKVIDTIDALVNLCDFTLPTAVRNKLIPAVLGGYPDVLDFKQVPFYQYATTASMVTAQIFKTATGVRMTLYPSSLTQNIEYYGRIEVTFLLSDNLAAE